MKTTIEKEHSLVPWAGLLKKWVLQAAFLWTSYYSAPHYSFPICRMGIIILNCWSGLFRLYILWHKDSFYCKTIQWDLNLDEANWGKKSSLQVLRPGKQVFKVIIWGEWVPFPTSLTLNSVIISMKVIRTHFRVSTIYLALEMLLYSVWLEIAPHVGEIFFASLWNGSN